MTTRNPPEPAPGPETSAGADLTPIRQAALSGEGSLLERVSSLIELSNTDSIPRILGLFILLTYLKKFISFFK